MRIVCVGEAMLELARNGDGWQLGHGGDTLNTAIHLARAGLSPAYLTALGTDPFSEGMIAAWQGEGLDCSLVLRHPSRQVGLYAISTDPAGERSFSYWRESSAAREMFELPAMEAAATRAATADMLLFSLITLAILPELARERLLRIAEAVRARGAMVVFDGNYRPGLWSSPREAAQWRDRGAAVATLGLPTLEDEASLNASADAESIAAYWTELGCAETVVKLGSQGCRLSDGSVVAPPARLDPVDTGGAGDAFNAGFLIARINRRTAMEAAQGGHALAALTIMHRGAIPPRRP